MCIAQLALVLPDVAATREISMRIAHLAALVRPDVLPSSGSCKLLHAHSCRSSYRYQCEWRAPEPLHIGGS
jgi:hypothetical protein